MTRLYSDTFMGAGTLWRHEVRNIIFSVLLGKLKNIMPEKVIRVLMERCIQYGSLFSEQTVININVTLSILVIFTSLI